MMVLFHNMHSEKNKNDSKRTEHNPGSHYLKKKQHLRPRWLATIKQHTVSILSLFCYYSRLALKAVQGNFEDRSLTRWYHRRQLIISYNIGSYRYYCIPPRSKWYLVFTIDSCTTLFQMLVWRGNSLKLLLGAWLLNIVLSANIRYLILAGYAPRNTLLFSLTHILIPPMVQYG